MTAHPAGYAANSRTRTLLGYCAFVGFAVGGGVLGWFVRTESGLLVGVVIGLMVAVAVWTLLRPPGEQSVDTMIEAKPGSEDSAADFAVTHSSLADHAARGSVAHASRSARTHRTGDL
ncbi:MAG: hypothetical protein NTV94_16415 [Planctomycetota bacterium]|nr:hypothetical protein [Planctomycetota bacterium]